MPGSVIRQNVCQRPAPSVLAACSCSSPSSSSTGTTARTTSGSDTNTVASTMPGVAKMTCTPWPASQPPTGVKRPYTRIRASPTTTGDTARGRSTSAPSTRRPGNRWRTSRTAVPTPNTVFAATAHSATTTVTRNACSASGVDSDPMNGPRPWPKVRHSTSPTGRTSRNSRYARATTRRDHLATPRPPAVRQVEREQQHQGDHEQDRRHRGGAGPVVALDLPGDVDRRDLGPERQVPGDQHRRAELRDGPGERQRRPGHHRRYQVG